MTELTKLLGFMSSWDRQAMIEKYSAMFDSCESEEALIEELGTPTKVAIGLARDYVPSPPPAQEEPAPQEPEITIISREELLIGDDEPEVEPNTEEESEAEAEPAEFIPEAPPQPAKVSKPKAKPGVTVVYVLLAILIGLPIAIVLICLGIPLLATGVGVILGAIRTVLTMVPQFSLFSDSLLLIGSGLVCCAAGLVLAWFGLWLSLELGWLWIGKVIFGLGKKQCFEKGVPQA